MAGLPQSAEMLVTLHDSVFTAGTALQLMCTEGLSLTGDTVSHCGAVFIDGGRLTLTDADSGTHELRVTLSAFALLTDTCDSSLTHEVTSPTCLLTPKVMFVTVNFGMENSVEANSSIFSLI